MGAWWRSGERGSWSPEPLLDCITARWNTALHAASDAGWMECAQLLCAHGADPTLRNMQGRTALDLARGEGMRGMLEEYGSFEFAPRQEAATATYR